MAKAIPELNLCVLLANPGQDGNFCTGPMDSLPLSDYDSVGRSRFRSESAITTRQTLERTPDVRPSARSLHFFPEG
jgi:hypothetical protein